MKNKIIIGVLTTLFGASNLFATESLPIQLLINVGKLQLRGEIPMSADGDNFLENLVMSGYFIRSVEFPTSNNSRLSNSCEIDVLLHNTLWSKKRPKAQPQWLTLKYTLAEVPTSSDLYKATYGDCINQRDGMQ